MLIHIYLHFSKNIWKRCNETNLCTCNWRFYYIIMSMRLRTSLSFWISLFSYWREFISSTILYFVERIFLLHSRTHCCLVRCIVDQFSIKMRFFSLWYLLSLALLIVADVTIDTDEAGKIISSSGHTNNWAVLVSTSRFWFNYRHMANTLSL